MRLGSHTENVADLTSRSSGRAWTTPSQHTPTWSTRVQWHKADAFLPSTYSHLVASSSAVVHTLGILLEDPGYKQAIQDGNVLKLVKGFLGGGPGRLKSREEEKRGYEGMNRDSGMTFPRTHYSWNTGRSGDGADRVALTVLRTMLTTSPERSIAVPRPFVYISAADAFRPLVPARYLETKREAELGITRICAEEGGKGVRPVFVRPGMFAHVAFPSFTQPYHLPKEARSGARQLWSPKALAKNVGLMYHPHLRPLSTLPSFLLSLSAGLADRTALPNPFASKSPLHGAAEALRTHPLHVDHVAEAVLRSIADEQRSGVVDVQTMREWAGFAGKAKAGVAAEGL